MAQGIRQWISCFNLSPKMNGNDELIDGAACIAGKAIFPMQSLSVKPKIPERKNWLDEEGKSTGQITSHLTERDTFLDSTDISIEIRTLTKDETSRRAMRRRESYAM